MIELLTFKMNNMGNLIYTSIHPAFCDHLRRNLFSLKEIMTFEDISSENFL